MEATLSACPDCSAALPAGAHFCPACGRRLESAVAAPRFFGLVAPLLALAVAVALLVLAVVLLALGSWLPALLLAAAAALLVPAYLAAARRSPGTAVTRLSVRAADRARDEVGVLSQALTTWGQAGREVVRLRHEQFRLRRELDEKLRELGRSVLDSETGSPALVEESRALEQRLQEAEVELERALQGARERLRSERAAVASTEVLRRDGEQRDAQ